MPLAKDVLVSIIIPCYNTELYIKDTIDSIINQSVENIEIIVVNDGSTDKSVQIIESIEDSRIKIINQKNKGVSVARNNGFNVSKGDFVIFFDADDIMSDGFIEKRIQILKRNLDLDFVCSKIISFKSNTEFISTVTAGPVFDIEEKILMFNKQFHTCPSNYMYRKSSLINSNIRFNNKLASPADRFFLLEVSNKKLKGELLSEGGELYYRIHDKSMSHHLTENLVRDTEMFYKEILKHGLLSKQMKNKALSKGYYIISGSSFRLRKLGDALKFALLSFFYSPIIFIKNFNKHH
ncbi:MAG: glycosyltransferase family 2 protein [Flavobacteriales bacterium]|nr:glycosyltransferase family 2 protein [Flavobacteriales bacterium]